MPAPLQRPPLPDVPEIPVSEDIQAMTDLAIDALSRDGSIFQRNNSLVNVIYSIDKPQPVKRTAFQRPEGTPVINVLELATLRERLSSAARWTKYDAKKQRDVRVVPPMSVVSAVMARKQYANAHLQAVITAPTLRPDGSLLQEAGYDESTNLLYLPNAAYPAIDEKATYDDALRAREELLSLVQNFPFADQKVDASGRIVEYGAHRSAWLAFQLTLVARNLVDGPCPFFAIDATTRGTGKSRLVHMSSLIAFGAEAGILPPQQNEDEFRKRATSLLLEGDRLVLMDNVEHRLGGGVLNALISSTKWKDRALGSNRMVTLPNLAVYASTGNNIQFDSDLTRRTERIRLESKLENPEDRDDLDQPKLLQYAREHRARFVACAVTILRAWFNANKPEVGKTMGTFEEWSEIFPPICRWLRLPDPLLVRASVDEALDPDRARIRCLMRSMQFFDPHQRGITTGGLIAFLYPQLERHQVRPSDGHDATREHIQEITRTSEPETMKGRLGRYLGRVRGRTVQDFKIEATMDSGVQRWFVLPVRAGEAS